jgi:acyl-coenzyme A synthetase/AMP-(fatty) acid ligase
VRDGDGHFVYPAPTDHTIISAGYDIAGPEVEHVLLGTEPVAESAVTGPRQGARQDRQGPARSASSAWKFSNSDEIGTRVPWKTQAPLSR